jgi:hypothetical protein
LQMKLMMHSATCANSGFPGNATRLWRREPSWSHLLKHHLRAIFLRRHTITLQGELFVIN